MMHKSSLVLTALVFLACLPLARAADAGPIPEPLTCYPEWCRPNGVTWVAEHAQACWHACSDRWQTCSSACAGRWQACSCACAGAGSKLTGWLTYRSGKCPSCGNTCNCTPYCYPPLYTYFLSACCASKTPDGGHCGSAPVAASSPIVTGR
jgi:hypothetical protein